LLFLGHPAEAGDPRCGIPRGLCVELGRAERGALERECRAPVGAAEAGACAVEDLERLTVAPVDLEHASQRKRDRHLSARGGCGIERRFEMSRRLPISRVRLGEAKLEEDVREHSLGGRLSQSPPQIRDGRVRSAVRVRELGSCPQ